MEEINGDPQTGLFPGIEEVHLESLSARVTVEVGEGPEAELRLDGSKKAVRSIQVNKQGSSLIIRQKEGAIYHGGGSTVKIQGSNNVVIVNGRNLSSGFGWFRILFALLIVVCAGAYYGPEVGAVCLVVLLAFGLGITVIHEGLIANNGTVIGSVRMVEIKLKVKRGTSLFVAGSTCGDVRIGDVLGPLHVDSQGSLDLQVGRMCETELNLEGSEDVKIAEVRGKLAVKVGGSADVRISDGKVEEFQARIDGSGRIFFGGEAKDVDLSIDGSGDITAARVSGSIKQRNRGSGKIAAIPLIKRVANS